MSAFVVSNKHINSILDYRNRRPNDGKIYANEHVFDPTTDLDEMAQILLDENYRSVNTRYSENKQPHKITWTPTGNNISALQVIKLCQCYNYQASESENYKQTLAAAIIDAILQSAIMDLPDYSEVAWSID